MHSEVPLFAIFKKYSDLWPLIIPHDKSFVVLWFCALTRCKKIQHKLTLISCRSFALFGKENTLALVDPKRLVSYKGNHIVWNCFLREEEKEDGKKKENGETKWKRESTLATEIAQSVWLRRIFPSSFCFFCFLFCMSKIPFPPMPFWTAFANITYAHEFVEFL